MPDVALSERGCNRAQMYEYNPRLRWLSDFVIKSSSIHSSSRRWRERSEFNSIFLASNWIRANLHRTVKSNKANVKCTLCSIQKPAETYDFLRHIGPSELETIRRPHHSLNMYLKFKFKFQNLIYFKIKQEIKQVYKK